MQQFKAASSLHISPAVVARARAVQRRKTILIVYSDELDHCNTGQKIKNSHFKPSKQRLYLVKANIKQHP